LSEEGFLSALRVDLLRHADLRPEHRDHLLFQTSTIDALLAGRFDGDVTIGELSEHGDLGLGTLNGCDGELLILDGRAWQARVDGTLHAVAPDARTPYAVVVDFAPDVETALSGPLDRQALCAALDAAGDPAATTAAARIEGRFSSMRVRSVPRQQPPYPPLADVIAAQRAIELREVAGTVVGFRFPGPLGGIEISGWHLHFATDDLSRGGHVLACVLEHGTAQIDHATELHVELPPAVEAPGDGGHDESLLDHLEHDG
jgi:acetolactate decarboxylase